MASDLLEMQRDFQGFVQGRGGDDFERRLATPRGADGARRMGVYHHAYRARLGGVLADTFSKTLAWIGDARFEQARDRYLETRPSLSPSLDDYGSDFPALLAKLWPGEPDITELAWLDWAMRRAFDGPDAAPIDPAALAALPGEVWDRARFVLHPTLVIGRVTSNVGALWASFDAEAPTLPPPLDQPMAVRVWRKGLQPHFRLIAVDEAEALESLARGASFSSLCEGLPRAVGADPVERAASLLATWLQDELIVAAG